MAYRYFRIRRRGRRNYRRRPLYMRGGLRI